MIRVARAVCVLTPSGVKCSPLVSRHLELLAEIVLSRSRLL